MYEWNSGGVPSILKYNRLLDAVVTVLKYNKITIYHAICIKVLSDGTVSYIKSSTVDVLNPTNN